MPWSFKGLNNNLWSPLAWRSGSKTDDEAHPSYIKIHRRILNFTLSGIS
jgi:hypothetical protein